MVQKQGRFMNVSRELRPSLRPNLQISSLQFALHIKPVQRVRSFLRRYLKGLPLRQGSHMFCSSITSMAGSTSDLVILVIHFNLDQKLNFSKIYAKRASCPNDIKKNPNEKQTKPTNPHKPKKPKIHKIQSQVIKLIIPLTTPLAVGTRKAQDEESLAKQPVQCFCLGYPTKFPEIHRFGPHTYPCHRTELYCWTTPSATVCFPVTWCKTRTSRAYFIT